MLLDSRLTRRRVIKFLLAAAVLPFVARLTSAGATAATAAPDRPDSVLMHDGWVLRSSDLVRLAQR